MVKAVELAGSEGGRSRGMTRGEKTSGGRGLKGVEGGLRVRL